MTKEHNGKYYKQSSIYYHGFTGWHVRWIWVEITKGEYEKLRADLP